jgi:hypothetical protein
MPVLIRNTSTGPTTFVSRDGIELEWAGKGDPYGGHILQVPDSLLDDVQFMQVLRGTILVEVRGDDVEAALQEMQGGKLASEDAEAQRAAEIAQAVENMDGREIRLDLDEDGVPIPASNG